MMYSVDVTVEGVGRGLLMHKFSAQATADLQKEVKKVKRAIPSPQVEAEETAFRLSPEGTEEKGQLMLPAEHFLGAMIKASSRFQVKGQGKKTFKGSVQGQIDLQPDYIPLTDHKGKGLFDYKIDSRPVRNPSTKGRVIRNRAHIEEWRAAFTIRVADDGVPLEVVQAILEEAGRSSCVGDYRPRFGQFRIASFEKAGEAE